MARSARRISAGSLEQQLPVVNPRDELGQLATTFNDLLARLNASLEEQRRFMADASHELRNPLSVISTATGVTLKKEHRAEEEYREALQMVAEQTRRLSRIVNDMFMLARERKTARVWVWLSPDGSLAQITATSSWSTPMFRAQNSSFGFPLQTVSEYLDTTCEYLSYGYLCFAKVDRNDDEIYCFRDHPAARAGRGHRASRLSAIGGAGAHDLFLRWNV